MRQLEEENKESGLRRASCGRRGKADTDTAAALGAESQAHTHTNTSPAPSADSDFSATTPSTASSLFPEGEHLNFTVPKTSPNNSVA